MNRLKHLAAGGLIFCLMVISTPAAVSAKTYFSGQEYPWPNGKCPLTYVVQKGDTLDGIAGQFGISLSALMTANRLTGDLIHPHDLLLIPDHYGPEPQVLSRGDVSRKDLYLLACLIYAEARGEPYVGQVAVGAVIMNRLSSPLFPKTIVDVIMQHQGIYYQFQPVADGTINMKPDATAIRAAISALDGWDPTHGALFFYNPALTSDLWIKSLPVVAKIGNHIFATEKNYNQTAYVKGPPGPLFC